MSKLRYLSRGTSFRDSVLNTFPKLDIDDVFDEKDDMTFRAWDLLLLDDPGGAVSLAQEVLVLSGECLEAVIILAEAAMYDGHMEKAMQYMSQAAKAAPNIPSRKNTNRIMGDRVIFEALPIFHMAESMGALLVEMGEYDKAVESLETVPSWGIAFMPWTRYTIIRLYTMAGKPDKALERFLPGDDLRIPGADYDVALCHIMKGDSPQAIQYLQEGFFTLPYIACALTSEPVPGEMREKDHEYALKTAHEYLEEMRDIWEKTPDAVDFMQAVWNHPAVRKETVEYCRLANRPLVSSKEAVDPDTLKGMSKLVSSHRLEKTSRKIAKDMPPLRG